MSPKAAKIGDVFEWEDFGLDMPRFGFDRLKVNVDHEPKMSCYLFEPINSSRQKWRRNG